MKVSMNGLRKQLTKSMGAVRDIAERNIEKEAYYEDEFIEELNHAIALVNTLNCAFIHGVVSFTDLSYLEIKPLEE